LKRWEAMNSIGNFPKIFVISVVSMTKLKNIVVFALTCVLETFALFFGDFCMELLYILLIAMKRGDEAFNGSSLQFLRSVKRFIASSLQYFTQR
jgi:hypothetical protein